jgi:hypothetical protein
MADRARHPGRSGSGSGPGEAASGPGLGGCPSLERLTRRLGAQATLSARLPSEPETRIDQVTEFTVLLSLVTVKKKTTGKICFDAVLRDGRSDGGTSCAGYLYGPVSPDRRRRNKSFGKYSILDPKTIMNII